MRMILIYIMIVYSVVAVAAVQVPANSGWQYTMQSIIGALDYVAIDYPGAVQAGTVVNAAEYAEQREFLGTVYELIKSLPSRPGQPALLSLAQELVSQVDLCVSGDQVANGSRRLVADLVETYNFVTAPLVAPDPASVANLYADQCAGCHGVTGHGDGLAGAVLETPPTNFHDTWRAQQRSLYGLYSTVSLGVAGAGMPSFSTLSEDQRWALAFYVAGMSDDPDVVAQGERLWNDGMFRDSLPTLASFTSKTPTAMVANQEIERPLIAYLHQHPEVLGMSTGNPVQHTIEELHKVVSAYDMGQLDVARQLALSAYLEGYELIEAPLRTLNSELAMGIERDMQVLRNMIRNGVPAEQLASSAKNIEKRLQEASVLLETRGSSTATLLISSFLILLREGLEAILLLAAMSLYLRRTKHSLAMRYLHFGWIGALAFGVVTWIGIKSVISISGAQRELIEGLAALLAAFVLLYVGIWLHRHSSTTHWQAFLKRRLGKELSTGTLWGIAALAFVAVYREILEMVLFYETLWLQSGTAKPIILGASIAAIVLFAAGWVVFRIGTRLPLRHFFQANSILMFVLALTFAGKGVTALQEAGWIGVTFINTPRIDWLGIYPTAQSVGTQLTVVCVAACWLALMSRRKISPLQH